MNINSINSPHINSKPAFGCRYCDEARKILKNNGLAQDAVDLAIKTAVPIKEGQMSVIGKGQMNKRLATHESLAHRFLMNVAKNIKPLSLNA